MKLDKEFMNKYYVKAELYKAWYAAKMFGFDDVAELAYQQLQRLK